MSSVELKQADESDIDFLFRLRNDPEVYKYYKNPRKVTYEEHLKWFYSKVLKKEIPKEKLKCPKEKLK